MCDISIWPKSWPGETGPDWSMKQMVVACASLKTAQPSCCRHLWSV